MELYSLNYIHEIIPIFYNIYKIIYDYLKYFEARSFLCDRYDL